MALWYRTGTVTVTNGSTTVTGSGTSFVDAKVSAGDAFHAPDGRSYEVASVGGATTLTLMSAYLGSNASGQSYAIQPTRAIVADWRASAQALVDAYQGYAAGVLAGKFPAGTVGAPAIAKAGDTNTGLYWDAADVLAVATGGSRRMRFLSTGAEITGLLSGTAVTQSTTDNTAARLLKVGDFGLGGGTPTLTSAQLDATVWTGFCRISEASGAVGIGSQVLNIYSHSAFSRQIAWVAGTGEVMIREQTSGVWGAWKLYSTSFGSNTNGRYVRLPDGTQICYHTVTLAYVSASIIANTWTFPAAFSANPAISWTASNQVGDYTDVSIRDIGTMVTFPSNSVAHCNLYRVSGAAGSWVATSEARLVRLMAIGRWF